MQGPIAGYPVPKRPGLKFFPGALAVGLTSAALATLALVEAVGHTPWLAPLQAAILALFVFGAAREVARILREGTAAPGFRKQAPEAIAVLAAALATFALHARLGLSSVAASSLVGFVASLASRRLGAAAFCGSFVGMASPLAYETFGAVAASGALAGLLFVAAFGSFDGFGGKLGTMALAGSLASAFFGRVELHSLVIPGWDLGLEVVAAASLGAVATVLLAKVPGIDAVRASSLAGLAAALFLPALAGGERGATLALAAFTGSFVGMSQPKRLRGIVPMTLAGAVSGLVFLFALPWFGGAGGKLGASAFVASVAVSSAPAVNGFRRAE
ncbi:MAG: hypothetical protein JXA15_02050 [Spirochaetales bacterium]|nr:hypothetical protein [Spirochaetales bacterium]